MKLLIFGIAFFIVAELVCPSFAQNVPDASVAQTTEGKSPSIDALRTKLRGEQNTISKSTEHKLNLENSLRFNYDRKNQVETTLRNYPPPVSIEKIDEEMQLGNREIQSINERLDAEQKKPIKNEGAIASMQNNIDKVQSSVNDLEFRKLRYPEEQDRYAKFQQGIDEQLAQLTDNITNINRDIGDEGSKIERSTQSLQSTLDEISVLLTKSDQTNSFKSLISITFASLVGIVIFGFFVIAMFDTAVRQAIFSHEFGIQFITLFSLIIAIILFGIIGILEGKELAALLGGLSGYILGRGTTALRTLGGASVETTPTP